MKDFEGCRAVVTGGASGIGLGLAAELVARGASAVTLVDVEPAALDRAVETLTGRQAKVTGIVCDVADAPAVEAMAQQAWRGMGGVEVVCLNAGVFTGGHAWEATSDDWDWVLGVNVGGVANGMRSFVPRLIEAGSPSHVLVTASIAGVVAAPVSAPYVASKFAAVGLAESLHHDLSLTGADHVAVSVVCPGLVATNIGGGARNRPSHLADAAGGDGVALAAAGLEDSMTRALDPAAAACNVFDQVASGRFYVSTHPLELWERLVTAHNQDRLAGDAPRLQIYE